MHGYHGRYYRIDVTIGRATAVPLRESTLRRYIGGVGLGSRLLLDECPTRTDPLGPDSPLIFAFSPLVGTPLTTSAKFAVVAKSPLTHRCNDALSSSHFALAGKRSGADAIVVVGRAPTLSALVIDGATIRLDPVDELRGLGGSELDDRLRSRYGGEFESAVIGPAGEQGVRYATIRHGSRHAGRGGLGAVMGSKNLKAILVRGDARTSTADPSRVSRLARELSARSLGEGTAKYRELGTVANLATFNRLNVLPTRNFQEGTFAGSVNLEFPSESAVKRSCAACTIGCEHIFALPGGSVRMEYETLFALGPMCGVDDRTAVLEAARRCDEYGIDTISTGGTIAFAMECAERGLLDDPDLRFGRADTVLRLIDDIAHRRGLGAILADGVRLAAERIGGSAAEFACHVKGLEMPGYEPRTLQSMALGLAVGTRGADHNRSGAYEADFSAATDRFRGDTRSVERAIDSENRSAAIDSLILCKFLRGVFSDFWAESAELLNAVTGWDYTAKELVESATRVVNLRKLFNIREGWTQEEDSLPSRFLADPLPDAMVPGGRLTPVRLQSMVRDYYHRRGWDETGRLSPQLAAELLTGDR